MEEKSFIKKCDKPDPLPGSELNLLNKTLLTIMAFAFTGILALYIFPNEIDDFLKSAAKAQSLCSAKNRT